MAEKEAVLTVGEAAEFLGVSESTASNVLAYMEALEVVQCVKRGRRHFYILKGAYDEERLSEILLGASAKPPPRPRRSSREPKKSKYDPILDRFLNGEHRLVEVTVEGKKAGYVRHLFDDRIKAMGLEGRVEAYVSDKTLHLEKV